MSNITKAFALALVPRYFDFTDLKLGRRVTWNYKGRRGIQVSTNDGLRVFSVENEHEAWAYAVDGCYELMDLLQQAEYLAFRGYALRGQLMLELGKAGFDSEVEALHNEIQRIFDTAMSVMPVKKVSKAKQRVFRINPLREVSWLEMRVTVSVSRELKPFQLGVRCLPSPFEENTWSVRLRHAAPRDIVAINTQHDFETMVSELRNVGITVKDVLNGTPFEI